MDGKSILFSGDYAEHSPLYPCDPLRSQTADLAVLDAAYGSTDADWNTCVKKLCVETVQCLKQTQLLFFPVPKYGRGPEILLLLKRFAPNLKFYGDAHFLRQLQQIQLVDRGCCLCRRILRTGCSRMLSSAGKKVLPFSADRS